MNPYWGNGFFSFLAIFCKRLALLVTGGLGSMELASDELQIFTLALVGISCALIGSFLVIKKMTMMANSITHTILVGIVLAFFLQLLAVGGMGQILEMNMKLLLVAALLTAILTMVTTDLLHRVFRLAEDASIGLVFSFFFAVGIVLVTILSRNSHIGSEIIMGNVDMIHFDDLKVSLVVTLLNIVFVWAFYKEMLITAFDRTHARMQKISCLAIGYLLMVQTSLTIISGFRSVGLVLVLALLVAPVLTARLWVYTLSRLITLSCMISVSTAIFSVALARTLLSNYDMAVSTAGLIVTVHLTVFLLSLGFAPQKGIVSHFLLKRRVRENQQTALEAQSS